MNPANFQNIPIPRQAQQGVQQPGGMQRPGGGSTDIRPHIFRLLQSQPVPPGWQTTTSLQQRTIVIHQIVTQLFMVKPDMTFPQAVQIAGSFERGEFEAAPDRATYEAKCRQKLADITRTRRNQADTQQQQFQQPPQAQMIQGGMLMASMANNPAQFQQGFGIPQQPQSMQIPGVPRPQQTPQNQRQMQNGNPMESQSIVPNPSLVQNTPQNAPPNRGLPQFSQEEFAQINRIAQQLVTSMTEEDKNAVRRNIMNLPLQQRQSMSAHNVNPFDVFIRNQAMKKFVEQKMMAQRNAGLAQSNNAMMVNQARPASQMSMRSQGQQAPSVSAPQPFDAPFATGSTDQLIGQQRDAQRLQEAGQIVVPASNTQGTPQNVRATPQQPPSTQFGAGRQSQTPNTFHQQPQPFWNTTQGQQQNMHQNPQMPLQPPGANFSNLPGQTPQSQPQPLQGQLGGLNNNRGGRTSQQNHNMPTLNQPLDPPTQTQKDAPSKPSQPTPKGGQKAGPNGQQSTTTSGPPNTNQQRPQARSGMPGPMNSIPPMLQRYIASLPEEQRLPFIIEMKKKQQLQRASRGINNTGQQNPTSNVSSVVDNPETSAGNSNVVQTPANPMHRPNVHTQNVQRPDQQGKINPLQQGITPVLLNQQQMQYMDHMVFPPSMLNLASERAKVPEGIKLWGQLKEWVSQNSANLPEGTLAKLQGLQSIHLQKQVHDNKQQIMQAANRGQHHQGGTAPVPIMVPQSAQPSAQVPNIANAFTVPPLPQPTAQEIQAARARIPVNGMTISDDQLRQLIMKKRQQEFVKMRNAQIQHGLQHPSQLTNLARNQNPDTKPNQFQLGPNQSTQIQPPQQSRPQQPQPNQQRPHSQTTSQGGQATTQQAKQSQPARPAGQNNAMQNKKRKDNNNDDVIEVPDPKLTQQQAQPPQQKEIQHPTQPPPGAARITTQQYASMPPEQKNQHDATRQAALQRLAMMQQRGQNVMGPGAPQSGAQKPGQNAGYEARIRQLMSEVAQTTPSRPPMPMSPNTRHQMIENLKPAGNMVLRMEASLPLFLLRFRNEDVTRDLLRTRQYILRQVQDQKFVKDKDPNPVENFTMSLEELTQGSIKIKRYLQSVYKDVVQPGAAAAQARPGQPQQLNAANLDKQQAALKNARAESVKKSHNNNNATPTAPITSHPPFPFGAQSPQGVPHFLGKNELTQEKLKMPAAKKRKGNNGASPASTPVQAQVTTATKPSPLTKVESPEAQRQPAAPALKRCPVADCETGPVGFATADELEKHKIEVHDRKEPIIKDPMDAAAFAIESMRLALNLDENGKSKPTAQDIKGDKGILQAPAMKASASMQGQNAVKQEAATPMSRIPTQTGPSPSSNMLKTPQAVANIKTPSSETKSMAKDAVATKLSAATKSPVPVVPDPWANSNVKREWFREVFSDVRNLNRPVSDDFITNWLGRNPISPPTSPSSGGLDQDSPRKSDISSNDNLNINLVGGEGSYLPAEWFDDCLPGDMAALDVGGEDILDMDWETAFGKPEEDTEETAAATSKGKKKRDPMDPSDEWLKVWAPEKYEENKKKDTQRKR